MSEDMEGVGAISSWKNLQKGQLSVVIRHSIFTYYHLTLLSATTSAATPAIDILAARSYLTSALQQYLGMTGTAIPIDFLKVDKRDIWLRLPKEDGPAFAAAISQWMGKDGAVSWRIQRKGDWLGAVVAGDGMNVFAP